MKEEYPLLEENYRLRKVENVRIGIEDGYVKFLVFKLHTHKPPFEQKLIIRGTTKCKAHVDVFDLYEPEMTATGLYFQYTAGGSLIISRDRKGIGLFTDYKERGYPKIKKDFVLAMLADTFQDYRIGTINSQPSEVEYVRKFENGEKTSVAPVMSSLFQDEEEPEIAFDRTHEVTQSKLGDDTYYYYGTYMSKTRHSPPSAKSSFGSKTSGTPPKVSIDQVSWSSQTGYRDSDPRSGYHVSDPRFRHHAESERWASMDPRESNRWASMDRRTGIPTLDRHQRSTLESQQWDSMPRSYSNSSSSGSERGIPMTRQSLQVSSQRHVSHHPPPHHTSPHHSMMSPQSRTPQPTISPTPSLGPEKPRGQMSPTMLMVSRGAATPFDDKKHSLTAQMEAFEKKVEARREEMRREMEKLTTFGSGSEPSIAPSMVSSNEDSDVFSEMGGGRSSLEGGGGGSDKDMAKMFNKKKRQ